MEKNHHHTTSVDLMMIWIKHLYHHILVLILDIKLHDASYITILNTIEAITLLLT